MSNETLKNAMKNKNDEFYTRYEDVKLELDNYKDKFKDKIILCNCNDKGSAFEKYFKENKDIKELIITEGRFQDNLEALEKCDIVVTNPPFSQFREFIDLLIEYKKNFIIWGNNNAITYKNVFPLLKDRKIFLGKLRNKTCMFKVPKEYHESGQCKVQSCSVFTTFNIMKVPELELVEYNEGNYDRFDNFNAINVDKIKDIPNYGGLMGVPITFMNHWNVEQFDVLDYIGRYFTLDYFSINDSIRKRKSHGTKINNKEKYSRILIKKKEK